MDLTHEWKPDADLGRASADLGGARWAEVDFRDFVAARSAALFRGALVLTGNRETAEDLVQETLERAWPRWRTIVAKDAPDAYVRRIMVNLANDRWRRLRRTITHQDNGDGAAPGDEYARVDSRDQLSAPSRRCRCACARSWCCGTSTTCPMPRSRRTWGSRGAPFGPSSPGA